MASIFFGRHGQIGFKGRSLSSSGISDVETIRSRLAQNGFVPNVALTSQDEACVATARLLVPDRPPLSDPMLFAFGDFKNVGVSIPYVGVKDWESGQEYATRALAALLARPEITPEASVAIIGHDHVPVQLAWRLIEIRGGTVDWNKNVPGLNDFPYRGEGLLVQRTHYKIFSLRKDGG